MKDKFSAFALAICAVLLFSFNANAQASKKKVATVQSNTIKVIQFHSEHRCMTCNLIEKLSKETLQKHFPNIPFQLVNVDDEKNEKMAEEFSATGTALFLYNTVTKKKKNLTDFAFMNAKSKPEVFKEGLKKEIEIFK